MSNKSLPCLNKLNSSMIWFSTFYYKYYKWMSSQYLYFLYFFNKIFTFLDFFFLNLCWVPFELSSWTWEYQLYPASRRRVRINLKPVTSYLINLNKKIVIYNIFHKSKFGQTSADTTAFDRDIVFYYDSTVWNNSVIAKAFIV